MTESTVAWRYVLLHLSEKLKPEEAKKIAFLYELPPEFRKIDVSGEDVLEYLEKDIRKFSPTSPDGLVDVFVNLERNDLAKQAKEKIKEFQAKQLQVTCRSALCRVREVAEEELSKVIAAQRFQQDLTLQRQHNDADQTIRVLKATVQVTNDMIVGDDATYATPSEPISPNSPVYQNRPLPPVHPTTPQPFKELNISPYARFSYYSKHPIPATCTDGTGTGNNTPTIFPHPQEEKGAKSVRAREDEEEEEEPVYEYVELLLPDPQNPEEFSRTARSRMPVKRVMSKTSGSLDLLKGEDEEGEKDDSSGDFAASEEYVTFEAITNDSNDSTQDSPEIKSIVCQYTQ